jgi:hypothetical protein
MRDFGNSFELLIEPQEMAKSVCLESSINETANCSMQYIVRVQKRSVVIGKRIKQEMNVSLGRGSAGKSFRKYLSDIQGKHEIKELHKTAILGTTHLLRKVLM